MLCAFFIARLVDVAAPKLGEERINALARPQLKQGQQSAVTTAQSIAKIGAVLHVMLTSV